MLLQDKLNDFKKLVDEGDPEAISVAPLLDDEKVGTQAADLRDLLVALADTDEGRSAIDETLKLVLPNPYPRYRDIGLVALGVACLAVPEADWVRQHLQLILETALNQEGVTFAFNLPAILIAEAEKRNLPAQKPSDYQKLSDYIAAAKTDDNNWGTAMRAHSAHAVAQFWQGNTSEAFLELGKASRLNTGFAGYGTLTLLSLANCYMEFGEPDRASASIWGSNQNASLLLAKAEALASMVRDEQFRSERRQLVQDFRAWSIASTPDIKGVLTAFSRMPDPDTFRLYIDHVTARWANPGSPYRESIKDLVPAALATATTLDTVLGRLFGLSLGRLSNDDLVKAIGLCADKLLVDLPGK